MKRQTFITATIVAMLMIATSALAPQEFYIDAKPSWTEAPQSVSVLDQATSVLEGLHVDSLSADDKDRTSDADGLTPFDVLITAGAKPNILNRNQYSISAHDVHALAGGRRNFFVNARPAIPI